MKFKYTDKIKWRIRILYALAAAMLVYMVAIVEIGGGDSRIMSPLASVLSRIIFFGGLICCLYAIFKNNKVLKSRALMQKARQNECDERNRYLYAKSGGIFADITIAALLASTFTSALFNMAAFAVSVLMLAICAVTKFVLYIVYSHLS